MKTHKFGRKRFMALLMVLCMTLVTLPTTAFAAGGKETTVSVTSNIGFHIEIRSTADRNASESLWYTGNAGLNGSASTSAQNFNVENNLPDSGTVFINIMPDIGVSPNYESIFINTISQTITNPKGEQLFEVETAEHYDIEIVSTATQTYNVMWTNSGATNIEGTDFNIPGCKLGNGKAFLRAVFDNQTDMNTVTGLIPNSETGCVSDEGKGYAADLIAGNVLEFEFVPDPGYQLTEAKANEFVLEAQDTMNRYRYIMPNTNVHFSTIFTPVEDVVIADSAVITGGEIALSENELSAGTAQLSVSDHSIDGDRRESFESAAGEYTVSDYLNILLSNVFYKGKNDSSDVWKESMENLEAPATITLKLDEFLDGEAVKIVHEKNNGEGSLDYELIDASYDYANKTIEFETDSFSTYAIAVAGEAVTPEYVSITADTNIMGGNRIQGIGQVVKGSNAAVTITPKTGEYISEFMVNGESDYSDINFILNGGTYTIENIQEDTALTVNFADIVKGMTIILAKETSEVNDREKFLFEDEAAGETHNVPNEDWYTTNVYNYVSDKKLVGIEYECDDPQKIYSWPGNPYSETEPDHFINILKYKEIKHYEYSCIAYNFAFAEGENQTVYKNDIADVLIVVDNHASELTKVSIGDTVLTEVEDYIFECDEAGATAIHLLHGMLETLAPGEYTVRFDFEDGAATTKLMVSEKADNESTDPFTDVPEGAYYKDAVPWAFEDVPEGAYYKDAVPWAFEDVPEGAYYKDAVLWAVEKEITNGTTPTTFSPSEGCTRAQAVTFLWRAAGSPAPTSTYNPFSDVKEGSYYYAAVLWAVEKGITKGTSDTTFDPNEGCTRAQIVTFLWRASGSPPVGSAANPFTDVSEGTYYYTAGLWAVGNDITNGTTTTAFSPNNSCTRGQIVTFLYRNYSK